jgi:hypothetical protein
MRSVEETLTIDQAGYLSYRKHCWSRDNLHELDVVLLPASGAAPLK